MREIYRSLHPIWQLIIMAAAGFGGAFVALSLVIVLLMALDMHWMYIFQSYLIGAEDKQEILIVKLAQITYAIGFFALPYYLHRKLTGESYYSLRFSSVKWVYAVLFGLTIALSFPFINLLAEWNSHLQLPSGLQDLQDWIEDKEQMANHLIGLFIVMDTSWDIFINVFLIAIMPALVEELFFRGMMQPILIKAFRNTHLAIWSTGFLFAFLHLQFLGFLPRMILGVLLGYMAQWSGTLWVPIAGHLANNFLALLLALLIQRGLIAPEMELLGSQPYDWTYAALAGLILISGTYLLFRLFNKKAPENSEAF